MSHVFFQRFPLDVRRQIAAFPWSSDDGIGRYHGPYGRTLDVCPVGLATILRWGFGTAGLVGGALEPQEAALPYGQWEMGRNFRLLGLPPIEAAVAAAEAVNFIDRYDALDGHPRGQRAYLLEALGWDAVGAALAEEEALQEAGIGG